ncbi:MAG TPA: ATP synthase F1 subunit delta [Desulfovibrio sp.]|nr:ATP synthase F1, delta subunit [Desulfovibrio sp. A2]HCG04108.1 ATP synthase F1 subunit delta [Desulfovibrio sp.]
MTGNIVARRYARALFALGAKSGVGELDKLGSDLAALAGALDKAPELGRIFRNPIITADEKRNVILKLVEKYGVSATVRNFCLLLADKGRLDCLSDIQAFYGVLLDAEKGVIRGELMTAVELAEAKRAQVKAALEQQAGRKLELTFSVNKDILGGVVLKVGDRVLDASLRAQLGILKDNIKRGE